MLQELLADPLVAQEFCGQITIEDLLVYLETELQGEDAARRYPQVGALLQQSTACQQEYAKIKAFLRLAQSEQWLTPPRDPRLSLAYLPKPGPVYQPVWYREAVGRLVVEFSTELLAVLQTPRPQPAYTFERSNPSGAGGYQFSLENQVADLNVQIDIQPTHPAGDRYQLTVATAIPSRDWPHLANTIVNLCQADTILHSRLTDNFGKAVFADLAALTLAQLRVEIIPGPPPESAPGHQSG